MEIIILNDKIDIPKVVTLGSAGFDLQAAISYEQSVVASGSVLIPTGLKIHINDNNLVGLIYPRSKLGSQGLVLANTIGVIDSDYQGEIFVNVLNRNMFQKITIKPLQKIAQLVFTKIEHPSFNIVTEFTYSTTRADGGITKTKDTNYDGK